MAETQRFRTCLQNVCGLSAQEAGAIVNQGYDTARKFRRIDKDSMKELFDASVTLENMRVARRQNLRALRTWLQDQDPGGIDLDLFTEDALEGQCDTLSAEREGAGKGDSDKSQDKPFVWDGDIFRLATWLENMYAWVGLKKNSRGVPLTWLAILKDTTPKSNGDPLEGPGFDEDPWTKRFRASAPRNVKDWAARMSMTGPQYHEDSQALYNHIVGRIKGEPLTIARIYLNNGRRVIRALLRKYMNAEQRRLMARAARQKLPSLKYQNEKGKNGLRDHIATLAEIFRALGAAGAPLSEAEKVMYLTESIVNEKLSTGTVSHIVASPALANDFTAASTHVLTTAAHLKITGPTSRERGFERIRGVAGVTAEDGEESEKDLKEMAKGYIPGEDWAKLSGRERGVIFDLRQGKEPRSEKKRDRRKKENDSDSSQEEEEEAEPAKKKSKKKADLEDLRRVVSVAMSAAVAGALRQHSYESSEEEDDAPSGGHGGENDNGGSGRARFGRQRGQRRSTH